MRCESNSLDNCRTIILDTLYVYTVRSHTYVVEHTAYRWYQLGVCASHKGKGEDRLLNVAIQLIQDGTYPHSGDGTYRSCG